RELDYTDANGSRHSVLPGDEKTAPLAEMSVRFEGTFHTPHRMSHRMSHACRMVNARVSRITLTESSFLGGRLSRAGAHCHYRIVHVSQLVCVGRAWRPRGFLHPEARDVRGGVLCAHCVRTRRTFARSARRGRVSTWSALRAYVSAAR